MHVIERNDTVERIFLPWRMPLRERYDAYKGHIYRVLNFTYALLGGENIKIGAYGPARDVEERIAIAACFHDAAFVFDRNADYLGPSRDQALAYLRDHGHPDWAPEIGLMIENHHKLSPYHGEHEHLVEPFRQADLIDLSLGAVPCGLPRSFIRKVKRDFPNAGFHALLFKTLAPYMLRHPLHPLPMMKR